MILPRPVFDQLQSAWRRAVAARQRADQAQGDVDQLEALLESARERARSAQADLDSANRNWTRTVDDLRSERPDLAEQLPPRSPPVDLSGVRVRVA